MILSFQENFKKNKKYVFIKQNYAGIHGSKNCVILFVNKYSLGMHYHIDTNN